jgi:hypothetical protein
MRISQTVSFHVRRRCAAACLALLGAGLAQAHETGDGSIPESPGLQIGASAALAYLRSDNPLPAVRLPGVLGMGDTPTDQRKGRLEHGTLEAGIRLSPMLGATVAAGWHDKEPVHTEVAWLEARPGMGSEWAIGAGRNRVPLGAVVGNAGHFDRYAQTPLAKRATFNGDWIEDGVNASWRPHLDGAWSWLEAVDVGAWRATRFPGSSDAPWAPVVHLRASLGDVGLDGFASRLQPRGRGAYVQRANSGHTHTAPQCSTSLRDITCFDGTVDVLGGSAVWDTPITGLQLTAAGLLRRERGDLYSQNGNTRYQGRTIGGWVEVLWQPSATWDVGVRLERLQGRHTLEGPGATMVATDANLLPNQASQRAAAMLGWRPASGWLVTFEGGRERIAQAGSNFLALRLLWTPTPLFAKNW